MVPIHFSHFEGKEIYIIKNKPIFNILGKKHYCEWYVTIPYIREYAKDMFFYNNEENISKLNQRYGIRRRTYFFVMYKSNFHISYLDEGIDGGKSFKAALYPFINEPEDNSTCVKMLVKSHIEEGIISDYRKYRPTCEAIYDQINFETINTEYTIKVDNFMDYNQTYLITHFPKIVSDHINDRLENLLLT